MKTIEQQNAIMKAALLKIATMQDPDDIEVDELGFTEWGCEKSDAILMAYENTITIAQLALGETND